MRKAIRVLLILLLCFVAAFMGAAFYMLKKHQNSGVYLANTVYMGQNVEGYRPDDILKAIMSEVDGVNVEITENNKTAIAGKLSEFGFTLDKDAAEKSLTDAMDAQKENLMTIFKCLTGEETKVTAAVVWQFDQDTFDKKVNKAALPEKRVISEDAEFVTDIENRKFYIIPEVVGNDFDEAVFKNWAKEIIENSLADNGTKDISMKFPTEFYILPQITQNDPDMQAKLQAYSPYAGAQVTYVYGSVKEVLDFETILSWLEVNGNTASVNEEKLNAFVADIKSRYNTRYRKRKFVTHSGKTITIPENLNEYGYRLNEDAECEQLKEDLTCGEPVEREPVYYKTNEWDNPIYYGRDGTDDLNGNYIEVSIEKQHLWFYKDGEVFLDSDVVTGDITKKRGTATGAYPIAYKLTDYTLTGGNGNGAYATKVKYWMPFFEGQGLHDATWRSSFGGSIYKGHGSHGCVNLPKKVAKKIYENISAGIAVIIY